MHISYSVHPYGYLTNNVNLVCLIGCRGGSDDSEAKSVQSSSHSSTNDKYNVSLYVVIFSPLSQQFQPFGFPHFAVQQLSGQSPTLLSTCFGPAYCLQGSIILVRSACLIHTRALRESNITTSHPTKDESERMFSLTLRPL